LESSQLKRTSSTPTTNEKAEGETAVVLAGLLRYLLERHECYADHIQPDPETSKADHGGFCNLINFSVKASDPKPILIAD
jgi:hypothetical protein